MTETQYSTLTDEELIDALRNGDTAVADYICDKYKNLVRKEAMSMFILGADHDDLIQEGMIGLFKAMQNYDAGRDASFFTFAKLCISRQIYTAVQASGRKKNIPLNNYISIYGDTDDDTKEGAAKISEMTGMQSLSPEETFIDKENVEYLERKMKEELSPFEIQVLELRLTGMATSEIARVLGREQKATDNALQRIKAKLKRIMDRK